MVNFKTLPVKTQRLLGLGVVLSLVFALPLFIWAIVTQRFDVRERASTGEPGLCTEQCPGSDGILRNCTPPESDGTPEESICNSAGRVEACGGMAFCCPYPGGTWTTDLSACPPVATLTPIPYPTATPMPYPTAVPTYTSYPYTTPPPTQRPFEILLKLEGVDGNQAEYANVTARLISPVLYFAPGLVTPPLPIIHVGGGIYKLNFGVWSSFLPYSYDYSIVLKGEKHLGVRFCLMEGQTVHCSASQDGQIYVPYYPINKVSLDFTGIPLPAGDTYPQDGVVDATDFDRVKNLLSKPCSEMTEEDLLTGDLDYSGCINIKDAFLIRKTLETRYDEY